MNGSINQSTYDYAFKAEFPKQSNIEYHLVLKGLQAYLIH